MTLEVGTNGLSDESAQHIGTALKINFKLEGISLWQNDISGRGAQCLAEGLQVSYTQLALTAHSVSACVCACTEQQNIAVDWTG